jgi:opacity protein-like surface antigen
MATTEPEAVNISSATDALTAEAVAPPAATCADNSSRGFFSLFEDRGPPLCPETWYVSLMSNWQHRCCTEQVDDPTTFLRYHDGLSFDAAIGSRQGMFRMEVEYAWFYNEINTASAAGVESDSVGSASVRALMFNFYRDLPLPRIRLLPYFGVGLGGYQAELHGVQPDYFQQVGGPFSDTPFNGTSDLALACQLRCGASVPFNTRTELFCGYRYFWGDEASFAREPFSRYPLALHQDDLNIHGVEMGLRICF